jgi:hypothetical protein
LNDGFVALIIRLRDNAADSAPHHVELRLAASKSDEENRALYPRSWWLGEGHVEEFSG